MVYCIKFVLVKISLPLWMPGEKESRRPLRTNNLIETHLPERINDLYSRFIARLNEIFFCLHCGCAFIFLRIGVGDCESVFVCVCVCVVARHCDAGSLWPILVGAVL